MIARRKELRGKAAKLLRMCDGWKLADEQSGALPLLVVISPPSTIGNADITSRLLLPNRCHDSMAGTGAICTAACSRIRGSTVASISGRTSLENNSFRISHPLGVMPVLVEIEGNKITEERYSATAKFKVLAFVRTARRIMNGNVYIPASIWNGYDGKE